MRLPRRRARGAERLVIEGHPNAPEHLLVAGTVDRAEIMTLAATAPRPFYDRRFRVGYLREMLTSGWDACVLAALRWALARETVAAAQPRRVLDYGCGQGRYMPEILRLLPGAELTGADISGVALELAQRRCPRARFMTTEDQRVPAPDRRFDLIFVIDVIEHVADAEATAEELFRLLRPGGCAILTTPAANRGSLAWLYNAISRGFEPTADGYGRFRTDEPAHLRRLRSDDAHRLLGRAGLSVVATRWWGHLFGALADSAPGALRLPRPLRRRLATVDWRLLRRLPSGAGMVIVARRPEEEAG